MPKAEKQQLAPPKQGTALNSKPHACPHCAAAFGKATQLTRHVRTVHEKRKDHVCPQCATAFGTASHLAAHVRTVHEKRKDHVCPHCAAAFGQAGSLARHVRTVHPDNSQGEVADCPPSLEAAAVVLSADHILEALLR